MTLLKKKVKQVSLDFKKLSADVVSRIEILDKEASLQNENDCKDDDCQIICDDDDKPIDERCNQKLDRFFSSVNPKPKELRPCGVTLDKCDAKIILSSDSDSESDESETHEDSSSEESEKDEDTENLQSVEKETKGQSRETKNTDKASNEPSEEKSAKEVKKRRTSAMVQAERKRKELDKARRRIEREAAKLKRMEELAKVKEEKRKEKEKAAAEREALKQQLEKEKEEKRVKREEAKRERDRMKEEERLKKEDEKQKKEEERKKREEEKQEKMEKLEQARKEKEEAKKQEAVAKKQEAEVLQRKVEKQAMLFNSFFIKDQSKPNADNQKKEIMKSSNDGIFGIFHVKKGMRLAPRRQSIVLSAKVAEALDDFLCGKRSNLKQDLYLNELRSGRRKAMTLEATWPLNIMEGDVQCLGTSFEASRGDKEWYRTKLLQFCENTRPSYYGTFRRRSRVISGRTPFQKDLRLFDYDIDSDEEWEEDPGESLSHSENEDEDEEDADEENDGFFVPHGYLSEDEEADDDEDRMTPEMRKLKQQMSEARFEASMKKKIQALVNVVVPPSVDPKKHPLLSSFKMIELTDNFPITISSVVQSSSATRAVTKNGVPDEAIPDIVRLVHGNKLSLKKLLFEFRMFWEHKLSDRIPAVTYEEDLKGRDWKEFSISKSQLEKRIREITKFEDGTWRVGAETLAMYPVDDVNCWKYITNVLEITRKKRVSSPSKPVSQKSPDKEVDKQKPTNGQPKTKTSSSVEAKNEATKTPIKRSKAKCREKESEGVTASSKTPSSKSPITPTVEGATPDTKMSPKSVKKTAQREAMQRLKAELLKETTKVSVMTSNAMKPESGSGDRKSEATDPATSKGVKSRKSAVKKRPNISASAPKDQKKTCPSSEKTTDEGKQKPQPPKKARKSGQNSTENPDTKPKSKPNQRKSTPSNRPKPNNSRKSTNKQGKEGDLKSTTHKSSEISESGSPKEIIIDLVKESNTQPDPQLRTSKTDKPSSVTLSDSASDQIHRIKENDTRKVDGSSTKESNSRSKKQVLSNDVDKSKQSTKHEKPSATAGSSAQSAKHEKPSATAASSAQSTKYGKPSATAASSAQSAKHEKPSATTGSSAQSTKHEKPGTTAGSSAQSTKHGKSSATAGSNAQSAKHERPSASVDTSVVSNTLKTFSVMGASEACKRANPEPLKETQPKVLHKSSTGKKTDEKSKMGEGPKSAKKVLMNGRPLKRLSDTTALTKVPARKVRFYDKSSEEEIEIIDLVDS